MTMGCSRTWNEGTMTMFGNEPTHMEEFWTSRALGLLRIVTALLFLEHGTSKMLGFPMTSMSFPPMWSLFWAAGVVELVGSLLLILGLFTRPAAFLLAGEMAIAYWYIHSPQSLYPMVNKGEGAILFCFIFLLFVFTGPGKWAVDTYLRRNYDGIEGYAAPGGERQYSPDQLGDGTL